MAIGQSDGNVPVSNDWEKMTCNTGDISTHPFEINGEIWYGPLGVESRHYFNDRESNSSVYSSWFLSLHLQ